MILGEKSRVYARLFGALIRAEVALIRFQAVYAAAEHYVAYGGACFTRYALKKLVGAARLNGDPDPGAVLEFSDYGLIYLLLVGGIYGKPVASSGAYCARAFPFRAQLSRTTPKGTRIRSIQPLCFASLRYPPLQRITARV